MSSGQHQSLVVLAGHYAVCRLAVGTPVPAWARGEFFSVTSTPDEMSVMCPADVVPEEVLAERNWRVLKLVGPFPFSSVGVLASIAGPLAQAGISLLVVSTYDTDYLLIKADTLSAALRALQGAGHAVSEV